MPDITVHRFGVGRELLALLVAFSAARKITSEVPRCLCVDDSCHESNTARRPTYEVAYEPVIH